MDYLNQRKFFDVEANQYSTRFINSPPLHTKLEIEEILRRITNVDKKDWILDFGAGSGRLTIPLLKNSFQVVAVDISKKSLAKIQRLAKRITTGSLIISTSIPKNQYGCIVGTDILHHIDLDEFIPIFYERLTKGGKIIFSEPGGMNFFWYIYLPITQDWNIEKGVINCTYSKLSLLLKKHGFRNIRITGLGLLPRAAFQYSKELCSLNDRIGNLPILKLFAYRYIIEAQK